MWTSPLWQLLDDQPEVPQRGLDEPMQAIGPSAASGRQTISATGAFRATLAPFRTNWLRLLLIVTPYLFVFTLTSTEATGLLAFLLHVFLIGPMRFGNAYALLIATRGETVKLNQIAVPFQRCYVQSVWVSLLDAAVRAALSFVFREFSLTKPHSLVAAGFVFFVVLGILYLAVRLVFVPYLIVDEELNAISAFRESWRRSTSWQLQIFLTIMVIILLAILFHILTLTILRRILHGRGVVSTADALGLALFGVGFVSGAIWSGLAIAYLYEEISVGLQSRANKDLSRAQAVPLALYI
jgi:hypothetical protein